MAGAGEPVPTLLPNRVQPGNSVLQQLLGAARWRGPRGEQAADRLQGAGRGGKIVDQRSQLRAARAAGGRGGERWVGVRHGT